MPSDPSHDPIATGGLGDVLRERIRHATDLGYDRDHDDALPVDWLARQAGNRMTIAIDRLASGPRRDLAGGRKSLVQAAALALAAIDRIDRAATQDGADLFADQAEEPPLHQRDWHG